MPIHSGPLYVRTGCGDVTFGSSYVGDQWLVTIRECPPGPQGTVPHPDDVTPPAVVLHLDVAACDAWLRILTEHRRRLVDEPEGPPHAKG